MVSKSKAKEFVRDFKPSIVTNEELTLTKFKSGAKIFYPNMSKVYIRKGKIIAIYSSRTRKIMMVK